MTPVDSTAALSALMGGATETISQRLESSDVQQRAQVAAEFESMFVSLLLKEMRQTVGEEGLFGGESSDIYGGMFDLYMGQHLAETGALGIGKLITQYVEMAKLNE